MNATSAILNTVKTAISVSIKNHLRAAAEKNHDIVQHLYDLQAAVQNAIRHGKADKIKIIMEKQENRFLIGVKDNGTRDLPSLSTTRIDLIQPPPLICWPNIPSPPCAALPPYTECWYCRICRVTNFLRFATVSVPENP